MKKLLVISLCIFFIGFSANAQLMFGLKGGLTLSKTSMEPDLFGDMFEYSFLPAFHVGALVALDLPMGLEFETGIYYNKKGFKIDETIEGVDLLVTVNPNYIDIPLKLNYKIEVGPAAVFFGVGPTISYGFGGEFKFKASEGGTTLEEDSEEIIWGDGEEDDLKPLDFGVGLQAGVKISKLRVSASYDMGLNNISPRSDETIKIKPVLGLSAAFIF
jgi:hypothetical protein